MSAWSRLSRITRSLLLLLVAGGGLVAAYLLPGAGYDSSVLPGREGMAGAPREAPPLCALSPPAPLETVDSTEAALRRAAASPASGESPDPDEEPEAPRSTLAVLLRDLQGERPGVKIPPETASILLRLEAADAAGDSPLRSALRGELRAAIHASPIESLRSLLELAVTWKDRLPHHPLVDPFLTDLLRVRDPAFREWRNEVLIAARERRRSRRITDPERLVAILQPGTESSALGSTLSELTREDVDNPEVAASLRELVTSDLDAQIRARALFRLISAVGPEELGFLEELVSTETDVGVRNTAIRLISRLKGTGIATRLIEFATREQDVVANRFAIQGLRRQDSTPEVIEALVSTSRRTDDWSVTFQSVLAMESHIREPRIGERLLEMLQDTAIDADVRALAALSLRRTSLPQATAILGQVATSDENAVVRAKARLALQNMGGSD